MILRKHRIENHASKVERSGMVPYGRPGPSALGRQRVDKETKKWWVLK